MDDQEWTRRLAAPLRGRKVIVAYQVLASMTTLVDRLEHYGARRPLLIALGIGTGPLPDPARCEIHVLDATPEATMSDSVRQVSRLAADAPPDVREWVEAYDPAGEAVWLGSPFIPPNPMLGRPVFGGRPEQFARLEDKLLCDEIWDAAQISRVAVRRVPAAGQHLLAASQELDTGDGTVWSGDARDGVNGGCDFVRWVRTGDQAHEAAGFFAANCRRVRVMPFLVGRPCSIHGFVLDDGVAAFRPIELVQLRDVSHGRFSYAGLSSWWAPPADDRHQMREVARAVGRTLCDRVGYRGGFSVDGVLTAEGFRPTELNPRYSGGLSHLGRVVDPLPLSLLQDVVVGGGDGLVTAAELERRVVEKADADRFAHLIGVGLGVRLEQTQSVPVELAGGEFEAADGDGSAAAATISAGPAAFDGVFVLTRLGPGTIRQGQSAAPLAAAALRFADRRWGTGFGPLRVPE